MATAEPPARPGPPGADPGEEAGASPNSPLRWRLRRGMRELDMVLERYHERRYPAAAAAERRAFAALLAREDPEIWQWLMGHAAVPPEFSDVIARLRRHD
jgi:antitoxin CptB